MAPIRKNNANAAGKCENIPDYVLSKAVTGAKLPIYIQRRHRFHSRLTHPWEIAHQIIRLIKSEW
jgi:hypothetical protein